METHYINSAKESPDDVRPQGRRLQVCALLALAVVLTAVRPAAAQERMYFPAIENAHAVILQKIRAETVRLDIAVWYLTDREISQALVDRFKAGVPVRLIGDRVAIFEIDPNTRGEFEFLASQGIPVRLRYHPTWFPEIMHWKCGIFVGQNTVEFGSANWTPYELYNWSPTDFKDETVMFTDDSSLVNAFLTKFDQMWANTSEFLDWPEVYRAETGRDWPTPMNISRARLEPDYPSPDGMIWSQGPELNNAMAAEIDREQSQIDMVIYRLSDPVISEAVIRRRQAGVPVRVFVEPTQYRQRDWPEYEMTGARIDQMWVAGAQVKIRTHLGLMHMKSLITSRIALNGSSNFTRNWQRDHNYFIPAQTKPSLHQAMRDRFDAMWRDTSNYGDFYPQKPEAPALVAPANSATGVSTTPTLQWARAPWAVAFDVYLGTSPQALTFQGRVNAEVHESPPQTYSWTPSQPLQGGTTYYWQVVSRTFATAVDPSLVAPSTMRSFSTGGSSGGGGSVLAPFGGTPVALPGTIQAENFDEGGAGIAYFDTTAGNSGGQYRNTNVDIETTADAGGGYNVGWMDLGEWLKYTVNVTTAGTYTIEVRVASAGQGGTFHIEVNGVDKTGPMTIPNTGGWQNWTTISKTGVALSAGQQVWTLKVDSMSAGGLVGNVNYIRVSAQGSTAPNSPPTVSLTSPANGATFTAPATINLAATASDADGTVAKVDFFSGTTLLNTDTSAPYTFTWSNVPAGSYTLRAVATDNGNASTESAAVTVTVQSAGGGGTSTPFTGTPVALPGTFQAEDFDNGGPGVAYLDHDAGNNGGQYRTTDVDIETTVDSGGGYNVGWVGAGEWLNYTVTVGSAGTYDIEARVASPGAGGTFRIEVNGADVTGPITVPNTGGWQSWVTIRKTGVALSAGQQVWRVVMATNGTAGAVGNFNWFRVVSAGTATPPPASVPEIVIYGADVPAGNLVGNWSRVSDPTAAAGLKLASVDQGFAATSNALASPAHYFDVTFNAQAGVRYRLWLRMSAAANDKFNDSVWVQFAGSVNGSGNPIYRVGTTQGLNVNLATSAEGHLSGWGWQNGAYWLPDTGEVWFASSGAQTMRVQIREDGVAIDQIILSPERYLTSAPGPVMNDTTIVAKP
jgi:phosphatidylserine/phosphatidylglycerophosphate/cardiolipin synthase-like enzyme